MSNGERGAGIGDRGSGIGERGRGVAPIALCTLLLLAPPARAQDTNPVKFSFDDRGLVFSAPAKQMEFTLRAYLQPMITLQGDDDAGALRRTTMSIRRARLALNGTTFDPRLHFSLQLGFSRQDLDIETLGIANIVADANVQWNWTPNFFTMVGQGKVFGDRQEINAASELEFPDRTIVYTTFGPDRDAGIMSGYTRDVAGGRVMVRASITEGEGRNSTTGSTGLAYGARVDWMPFGAFNAFSEGDLAREQHGRMGLGAAYLLDAGAVRAGGLNGPLLFSPRDMRTTYFDAIWKLHGAAIEAEYVVRDARDPITRSGATMRAVFAGYGVTGEASYVFPSGFMPALRVSSVVPDASTYGAPTAQRHTQEAVEIARFLKGHHLKWQIELGRDDIRDPLLGATSAQLYTRLSVLAGL